MELSAQNLKDHQWENRIVLLLADQPESSPMQKQLEAFSACENGLEERKILVYQVTPDLIWSGLEIDKKWKDTNGQLYRQYSSGNLPFELILIGLDGGVKMRKAKIITCQSLYGTIDVMPMRKAEMRRKKN